MNKPSCKEFYRIKTSGRIVPLMSRKLYEDDLKAFEEIIANAYDADATTVYTYINYADNIISVEDNGEGMDDNGLKDFFDLGSPSKEVSPTTPRGRLKIGAYGIGKIASNRIANKVTIYTLKNQVLRKVRVSFEGMKKLERLEDYELECNVYSLDAIDPIFWRFPAFASQIPERAHGTVIVLEGLKRKIDQKDVYNTIRYKMPLRPDFKVFINKTEVKEPKIENPEKNFPIDSNVPHVGRVHGSLIYASASLGDRSGVWVRVRGRVVNNEGDLLNIHSIKIGIASRLYGDINADGLQDAIALDREGFDQSNPKWLEFKKFMVAKIKKDVVSYYIKKEKEKELKQFKDATTKAGEDITRMLKGEDIKLLTQKVEIDTKNPQKKKKRKIRPVEGTEAPEKPKKKKAIRKRKKKISSTTGRRGVLVINDIKFTVVPGLGGGEGPECEIEMEPPNILINVEHPHFLLCKNESLQALRASIRRAMLLQITKDEVFVMKGGQAENVLELYDTLLRKAKVLLSPKDIASLTTNKNRRGKLT